MALSDGNYIAGGLIYNRDGMVVGRATDDYGLPVQGTTSERDPNYNPGVLGWLWDGVTHPGEAWHAFENNTLVPAARAVGDATKSINNGLNNFINNGGAAGATAGAVLNAGAGVSTNNGFHQGAANPNLGPSQAGWNTTMGNVDQSILAHQNTTSPVINNTLPGYNGATAMYPQLGAGNLGVSTSTLSPGAAHSPPAPVPPVTPAANRWYTKNGVDYGYDGKPLGAPATTTPTTTTPASGNGGTYGLALPGLGGAAAVAAGGLNALGSKMAADAQATAASEASKLSSDQFNAWLGFQREQARQQQENITPWLNAGGDALGHLSNFQAENPNFDMSKFQADPGYAFRISEGMKALQNSAAARGGLLSGNTLKGITNYGQEAGSQEYNNAFNRYQTERNVNLNRLQSLAGLGQTAVNQANQVSQNNVNGALTGMMGSSNALANGITGAADANASGYKGVTNALSNALGGYVQGQRQDNYINALGGY